MSVSSTAESLGALLGDPLRRTLVLAPVLDDVQLRDMARQAGEPSVVARAPKPRTLYGEPSVVACADEPRLSQ